jgi:hypothetical protein
VGRVIAETLTIAEPSLRYHDSAGSSLGLFIGSPKNDQPVPVLGFLSFGVSPPSELSRRPSHRRHSSVAVFEPSSVFEPITLVGPSRRCDLAASPCRPHDPCRP